MATRQWTLLDSEKGIDEEPLVIDRNSGLIERDDVTVQQHRLKGGLSEGVEEITVRVGDLKFVVLPTRGMALWKAWRDDFEFGWKSPVRGPVHPCFVPTFDPGGLGWLEGFDELMVRCGLESNGAPGFDEEGRLRYPLHGRIGNRPAREVDVTIDEDSGEVTLKGIVEEIRFHFLKLRLTSSFRAKVGSPVIEIIDEVENLSASPATMQMLYHVNFGAPLLDGGSQFIAPVKEVVPRNAHAASGIDHWHQYNAPQPGFEEQVYFLTMYGDEQERTKVLLKNAHGMQGAAIQYQVNQLPCFSVWKNTTALDDGYVTGIEPGTNYPNPREYETEQGRVVNLPPRGKTRFELGLSLLKNETEIAAVEKEIDTLRGDRDAKVYDQPQKGWCADA